jgi:hypothetical protein
VHAVTDEFGRTSWRRRRPQAGEKDWQDGTGVTVL